MKKLALVLAAVLCASCATRGSGGRGPDAFVGGQAGDLRLLVDDACLPKAPDFSTKSVFGETAGFATQLLSGLGGALFQSFGAYLKEAGSPDITRSVATNGGQFYQAAGGAHVTIDRRMRCLHLVRNGFAPQRASIPPSTPADLKETWTRLGLTRAPDFYALLVLETAGEAGGAKPGAGLFSEGGEEGLTGDSSAAPPFFRLRLARLAVQGFQNPQAASGERDLAIVVNYGQATMKSAEIGPLTGVAEQGARFGSGGVRLTGVTRGAYDADSLKALQTAWIPLPGVRTGDPRATVDITAYVVEVAPGNPMLQAIGEYLSGPQARTIVEAAIAGDGKDRR